MLKSRLYLSLFLILIFCSSLFSSSSKSEPEKKKLTIAYFTPRGDNFWAYSAKIAQAVSHDIGVELVWLPAYNKPELYMENADKIFVQKNPKVDAVVFKNYNQLGKKLIEMGETAKIPVFAIEEGIWEKDRPQYGEPRQKYKYWLGEFVSDDFDSGYRLANYLIDKAKSLGLVDTQGKVQMAAITGNSFEGSSYHRIQGLHTVMQERHDVIVNEIVAGYWKLNQGKKRLYQLLHDYPETNVVWIANDSMAVGASEAVKEMGLVPGQDILLSSINTVDQGVYPLVEGDTTVSIGGQFLLGGWACILLYDYLHGFDFAVESTVMRLSFHTFTQDNINPYFQTLVKEDNWEAVDFKVFSKAHTPALKKYDFNIQTILKQLQNKAP